jgi:hypothetical protein
LFRENRAARVDDRIEERRVLRRIRMREPRGNHSDRAPACAKCRPMCFRIDPPRTARNDNYTASREFTCDTRRLHTSIGRCATRTNNRHTEFRLRWQLPTHGEHRWRIGRDSEKRRIVGICKGHDAATAEFDARKFARRIRSASLLQHARGI